VAGISAPYQHIYVFFIGDFGVIPAPSFKLVPAGRSMPDSSSYQSDLYYRDLHTEFDRDGDGVYGEYDTSGSAQDFDNSTFASALSGISNNVVVGRLPVVSSATVEKVRSMLDAIVNFERETGPRKKRAILTAGRIDTTLSPADSWEYVLKNIVVSLRTNAPDLSLTTAVQVDPSYTNRSDIDYVVEGTNVTTDYVAGQDIVRGLLNSNDNYSFIGTVSHGSSKNDFALTRTGLGLPTNRHPFVVMSISCSSYLLGKAALSNGIAVAWLGSVAVVTPDATTLASGSNMVSGDMQALGTEMIIRDNAAAGHAFDMCFSYYVREIVSPRASLFFSLYKPELLRNVVGFQLEGDPTLVHARPDTDGDALLDAEEVTLGTSPTQADTDSDGLPDGWEYVRPTVDPLVNDGSDVDEDGSRNADELIAGTDPLDELDCPALSCLGFDSSDSSGTFEWMSVTGRTYRVQRTPRLIPPSWTNYSEAMSGTGGLLTFTDTNTTGAATFFYRLQISQP
jgi:hypothetical protein